MTYNVFGGTLNLTQRLTHTCRCGAMVDVRRQHGLICKQAPSRMVRHNVTNDITVRSLSSAGIRASKEPTGLTRLDSKRPDGLTLVPWQGGKPVIWDITVVSTLAQSYLHTSLRSFCCWIRRTCRLTEGGQVFLYPPEFLFVPIALKTLAAIAPGSLEFLTEVDRRLSAATGDARETAFSFQCISVAIQRFNAAFIHESFVVTDVEPDL